jgi:phytoene dehydrogenase-like protein
LPATTVVLAVDPTTAQELVGVTPFSSGWRDLKSVTAACLDIALSRLPDPKRPFAIGLDRPVYLGVHSVHAQLTPRGGALVHAVKYLNDSAPSANDNYDAGTLRLTDQSRADEKELETLLDEVQPGWRDVVVHRRFLPALTVSNAVVAPGSVRPSPITPMKGLYLVGDWVDSDGTMADGALSSARAVAKAILAS